MAGNDEQFARMMLGSAHPSLSNMGHATAARTTPSLSTRQTLAAKPVTLPPTVSTVATPAVVNSNQTLVDITDPEYVKIKADLDKIGRKITKLVKLNNAVLIENFETELAHLKKIKKQADFQPNIQLLYHGTRAPLEQICDEGLDERLSRRGRFGRGIYFSDNPEKCCKYSEHNTQKPYLLRCRVIMGDVKKFEIGEQDKSLTREPLKTVKDGKRVYYDSVKGQPHIDKPDHTEFVIYEKRRVLLDYVVYYIPPQKPAHRSSDANSQLPGSGRNTPTSGSDDDSGAESPHSGQDSPVISADEGEAEPVPRVKSTRNRTAVSTNRNTSASAVTSAPLQPTTAPSSSGQASASTTSNMSLGAASSPHVVALKNLLLLKDCIPQKKYDELTKSYFQTYGVQGDVGTASQAQDISRLVDQFKVITNCQDVAMCRQYILLGKMDLNTAIDAYLEANS